MINTYDGIMLSSAIADTYSKKTGQEIRNGLNFTLKNMFNGSNGKEKPSLEEQIKLQENEVRRLEKCFKDVDEEKLDKIMKDYREPFEKAEGKEKKKVLKKFRKEFADILIKDHEWQKPVAHLVAGMTKPEHNSKTKTKKAWDKFTELFISAEGGGYLPQFYVGPLAKSMKIERSKITSNNIKYSIGLMVLAAGGAVGVPVLQDATEFIQNAPLIGEPYKALGDYFTWMFRIGAPVNFFWTGYRLKKHYKDNEHTSSLASLTAPLPIPVASQLINIYLFSYAGVKKIEYKRALKKLEKLNEMNELSQKKHEEMQNFSISQQDNPLNTAVKYYRT